MLLSCVSNFLYARTVLHKELGFTFHPSKVGKVAKSSAMMLLDEARFCDDLTPEQEMSTILQVRRLVCDL